jgi:hypothetical protein
MNLDLYATEHPPSTTIEALMARHGAWRILRTTLGAFLRRKRHKVVPLPSNLSGHLLRDIGLPPEPESPRHWDLR